MSLRSLAVRCGIALAGGAVAALAAGGPALAGPGPNDGQGTYGGPQTAYYKGRVIARTGLLLRDAPTRSASVIRSVPYGAVVSIYCKTRGENVDGNNLWYLLPDGTWAWGSARYIENIGSPPRFC